MTKTQTGSSTDREEQFIRVRCANREEWLIERKKGIGGSDAATIIGQNPWKSNQELFREKVGQVESEDISHKPAVRYGNDAEEPLRQLFALDFPEYGLKHEENMLMRNKRLPFLQYSPDGELTERETGRRGLLEIKTTTINSSRAGESWAGKIPQNYYCQIMHGLLVSGYDFVILKAQLKYDYGKNQPLKLVTRHYHFEKNDQMEDLRALLPQEIKFWKQVEAGEEPALILPTF